MALSKVRFGDYIKLIKEKCGISNLTPDDVSGINRDKEFFEPSKQVGEDTSNYKIVPPKCFACNIMHVGRDVVLPIALNTSEKNKIVSPAYTVFEWTGDSVLLKEFLFMMLKSNEKDRYFWFHCDSSIRDGMNWDAFCDIELEIPSIETQKKYVAIYEGLLANLRSYEKGLDDLKLVCDGYIEDLRRKYPSKKLSSFAKLVDNRNSELKYSNVYGLTVYKKFIETKANLSDVSLHNYKIVKKGDIAFVPTTNRNGDRLACALCKENCIVSQIYETMELDEKAVYAPYIFMWFERKEMDRYARYNSWGSARENITWEDLGSYKIPIPPIDIQKSIAKVSESMCDRKSYIDTLKQQISSICPILIRGSILESQGGN